MTIYLLPIGIGIIGFSIGVLAIYYSIKEKEDNGQLIPPHQFSRNCVKINNEENDLNSSSNNSSGKESKINEREYNK